MIWGADELHRELTKSFGFARVSIGKAVGSVRLRCPRSNRLRSLRIYDVTYSLAGEEDGSLKTKAVTLELSPGVYAVGVAS
jgi:hypothetical protein